MHLTAFAAIIPNRLRVALGMFALVIVSGTVGYQLLTSMGFVDALYQLAKCQQLQGYLN